MPASFEMKGGRNIESNARKRVAEKNDEAIPKMQKKILFVLDMALITLACLEDTKTEDHSGHFALQPGFSLLKGAWCIESQIVQHFVLPRKDSFRYQVRVVEVAPTR